MRPFGPGTSEDNRSFKACQSMMLKRRQVLYRRLCVSPLRHIPGPFWAKTTSKWLTIIDLLGHRTATIHQLHEQYGPVVRVGPHEVSFSNIESIKDIYGAQTAFIKAPIYEAFSTPPYGIFSQRNKTLHAQRRRLLSHVFAQSNLYDTEPMIQKHVLKLLKILRAADREPIDVLYFFRVTAFDIVGESCSQSARFYNASHNTRL